MNGLYLDTKTQNTKVFNFRRTMSELARNLDTIQERFTALRKTISDHLSIITSSDKHIISMRNNAMKNIEESMNLVERRYTLLRLQLSSLGLTISDLYNRSHLNRVYSSQIGEEESEEISEINRNNNKVIEAGRTLRWLEQLTQDKVDQLIKVNDYVDCIYSEKSRVSNKNNIVEVMVNLINDTDAMINDFTYIAAAIDNLFLDLNTIIKGLPEEVRGNSKEWK